MTINPNSFTAKYLIAKCVEDNEPFFFIEDAHAKETPTSNLQKSRVESLLNEPIIEDYTDSIKFNFGDQLNALQPTNNWVSGSMELVGAYNDYQRHWMGIAWEMSHNKDFLYMMKGENGLLNHDRQSEYHHPNGSREDSWGFCQFHRPSHPSIVNDQKFFSNPEWQLQQCHKEFLENPWKFNAYTRFKNDPERRRLIKSHFKFT